MGYNNADRWRDAVTDFEKSQLKVSNSTTARRVKHLRRFAKDIDQSPWHVTPSDVAEWLSALAVADETRRTMRDSLRAFYRWALGAGKVLEDPTAEESRRATRLPVPAAWEQPLTAYERYLYSKGTMPNSVRAYMEQLRTFAREHPSLDPFAVTLDDLFEWMAGKRWARETRRARKVSVSGFYQWATETGRTSEDPTAKLPVVRVGDPVARPATDVEYQAALLRADDERWALALRLAAELGLRREEVARIHSADITTTPDGDWLTVHGKGDKPRRVPLPASLALTLRTRPEGYVFPGKIVDRHAHASKAGHLSARYLGKQVGELLPPGVTMHALRHRFATRAYNVDRDVFTLQKLLGHASAATTQRYVQVSDARMRALVESAGR